MKAHIEIRPIHHVDAGFTAEATITHAGNHSFDVMLFARGPELSALVWVAAAGTTTHVRGYDAERLVEKIIGPIFAKRPALEAAA